MEKYSFFCVFANAEVTTEELDDDDDDDKWNSYDVFFYLKYHGVVA